jgi:TatD DNase family protein
MFIDTHTHLDLSPFAADLDSVLDSAATAGVREFVVPGVSESGWDEIAELARRLPAVRPAFGLHPMNAAASGEETLPRLDRFLANAVAVGEIGLDYGIPAPRRLQVPVFREQLRLAVSRGLPVILHCRRAFRDLLAVWREEGGEKVGGVMHAFSGSVETMRECVSLGLFIGVAGPVTWENAVKPVELARLIPSDRLVLETDAPDLTPEPHRGKRNEPAFLTATARRVAEIRGISVEELARETTENARRLFRL